MRARFASIGCFAPENPSGVPARDITDIRLDGSHSGSVSRPAHREEAFEISVFLPLQSSLAPMTPQLSGPCTAVKAFPAC